MATQKPISTISYNTESFLKEKLDLWVAQHLIQCYQYILHKGEDGDKDHIHLRLEPNKKLDPMDLSDALKEYPIGCSKPLGVRPWRPSKEEDWILYVVHDPQYLKLKYGGGEKGEKIPYSWKDIVSSDGYDVEVMFIRAKSYLEHTSVNLASQMKEGTRAFDLILQGENPYLINALMRAVSTGDYERLHNNLDELTAQYMQLADNYDKLMAAIRNYGCTVSVDDEGNFLIS